MSTTPASRNSTVDYIEFPTTDMEATKRFYTLVFGWVFEDYGPDYASFRDGRTWGGFFSSDKVGASSPLVVIYADDLVAMEARVTGAGGRITKEAFDFPGGRRFHFADPGGNELAVWTEIAG
jgi:predicted enzyme related to lactoylglutathione lyase